MQSMILQNLIDRSTPKRLFCDDDFKFGGVSSIFKGTARCNKRKANNDVRTSTFERRRSNVDVRTSWSNVDARAPTFERRCSNVGVLMSTFECRRSNVEV